MIYLCVHRTWFVVDFIHKHLTTIPTAISIIFPSSRSKVRFFFSTFYFRRSRGCPGSWSKVSFSTFYFRRSRDCPIAWFKLRFLFFKPRAPNFLTLSTTLGLHLHSCKMWVYFLAHSNLNFWNNALCFLREIFNSK